MKTAFVVSCSVLLAASSIQAQFLWTVGIDDNAWPLTGMGGGPNAVFVQEAGTNPLPGRSTDVPTTPASTSADDDYYLAGSFTMAIASVLSFYGDYMPVGDVPANEEAAERAFAGTDNEKRYHFNL